MNREQWLNKAVRKARPMFKKAGHELPENVRVGSGHMGTGLRSKHIGECWHSSASEDAGREIWIRPDQTDAMSVLGTLVHELVHAALPDGTGHKGPFKKLGEALLLVGKPTHMTGGEDFAAIWQTFVEKTGAYPQPKFMAAHAKKKQQQSVQKFECDECGMVFRTSLKWADSVTECPCCHNPM